MWPDPCETRELLDRVAGDDRLAAADPFWLIPLPDHSGRAGPAGPEASAECGASGDQQASGDERERSRLGHRRRALNALIVVRKAFVL